MGKILFCLVTENVYGTDQLKLQEYVRGQTFKLYYQSTKDVFIMTCVKVRHYLDVLCCVKLYLNLGVY